MKTKFFFLCVALCFLLPTEVSFAQEDCDPINTFPWHESFEDNIVNDNNSWATLSYGLGSGNAPCCVSTEYTYFDGDSIVNGFSFKKVFSCNDELHTNIKFEGLMRENEQKTYIIKPNSETEYLLYDFSLEEGTSFEYWDFLYPIMAMNLFVKTIDFIEINGALKKRINLTGSPTSDWIIDIWVEGMGSMSGILHPCYKIFTDGGVNSLLCFFQDDELIFKNSEYSKCYYDNIEDLFQVSVKDIQQDLIRLYTNENNLLHIVNGNDIPFFIYDIQGRNIKSITPANDNVVFDLSNFPKGLYIVVNQIKSLAYKIIVK